MRPNSSEKKLPLFLASDHAGYPLKVAIIQWLDRQNIAYQDLGVHSPESVDYPDIAARLADALADEPNRLGIAICGSGNGICMALNRYRFIRAALCWTEELARYARAHNNANVLCLSGWFLSAHQAFQIIRVFLETEFEGGRHLRRVEKLSIVP